MEILSHSDVYCGSDTSKIMSLDHNYLWDHFQDVFKSELGIREGWNRFIEFFEQNTEFNYCPQLKALDVEAEQVTIKDWLESLVTDEPLGNDIIALWIGINKFTSDDGENFCGIYAAGAESYDADDVDWACDLSYWPENRYFRSDVLDALDAIIKGDESNYAMLDWILPLVYVAFTMNDLIMHSVDKTNFLRHQETIFITTGHDSGDWINLCPVSR